MQVWGDNAAGTADTWQWDWEAIEMCLQRGVGKYEFMLSVEEEFAQIHDELVASRAKDTPDEEWLLIITALEAAARKHFEWKPSPETLAKLLQEQRLSLLKEIAEARSNLSHIEDLAACQVPGDLAEHICEPHPLQGRLFGVQKLLRRASSEQTATCSSSGDG